MSKDLISLPSGKIINLANVAYITPLSGPKIAVLFLAIIPIRQTGTPLTLQLDNQDSEALLTELANRGVEVSKLWENVGPKGTRSVDSGDRAPHPRSPI